MYTPYYRTPRLYLSGYQASGHPLPPMKMMEDIAGDYKDKTVTLEEFPFFANHVRMASVHPCKHAPVMKSLLDRADAALRLRREKLRASKKQSVDGKDVEGLTSELDNLDVKGAQDSADKDEWEEVQENEVDDQEVAIRVDQYLVVFLKVSFSFSLSLFIRLIMAPSFLAMLLVADLLNRNSSWPALRLESSMISRWASKCEKGPCIKTSKQHRSLLHLKLLFYTPIILII